MRTFSAHVPRPGVRTETEAALELSGRRIFRVLLFAAKNGTGAGGVVRATQWHQL